MRKELLPYLLVLATYGAAALALLPYAPEATAQCAPDLSVVPSTIRITESTRFTTTLDTCGPGYFTVDVGGNGDYTDPYQIPWFVEFDPSVTNANYDCQLGDTVCTVSGNAPIGTTRVFTTGGQLQFFVAGEYEIAKGTFTTSGKRSPEGTIDLSASITAVNPDATATPEEATATTTATATMTATPSPSPTTTPTPTIAPQHQQYLPSIFRTSAQVPGRKTASDRLSRGQG